jgi:hypothetical protein
MMASSVEGRAGSEKTRNVWYGGEAFRSRSFVVRMTR